MLNMRIQNLATPPSNVLDGFVYFNTTMKKFMGYANGDWVTFGHTGEVLTTTLLQKINGISPSATKVEDSTVNGNIKINGTENVVYTHPGTGTNPHSTTKADVGLGSVENKSATTILAELTAAQIAVSLGFSPRNTRVGLESAKGTATGSKTVYIAIDSKKIYLDNANESWLQIGGQETLPWGSITGKPTTYTPPIATPSNLGGVKVGANMTVDANGVLNANDNPTSFILKEESFIATAGQTIFNLSQGQYRIGLGTIEVFINGAKIANSGFNETSTTRITLSTGMEAGDHVLLRYIELINITPYPSHHHEHLPGGVDPIPLVTTTVPGLMDSADKVKLNSTYTSAQADAEISAAVNGLINGSPGALDTLNELAAAMGDDPNFAATIANTIAGKVDKITGKNLSANDFTNTLLAKLNGIATGANKYSHPSKTVISSGLKKIGRDSTGHVTDGGNVTKADITGLGIPGQDTVYAHPIKHPASIITQDQNNRFVSDTEKTKWNAKTRKYVHSIGNGSATSIVVSHNLNTRDISVTLRETASPYRVVMTDIAMTNVNSITLTFAKPPSSNKYTVMVVG